ncbi:ATP dependent DNA ligase domain-containing protein [Verticillium dahliae VdLs.17]|uniref:ATP dependent DNA ligase domain-containing protein n=1 Tax=Verticillium dahliae (strain VdLs.17 / ATCC MYA-4575 / FGSC 10137) TaxID=498257 RepID=G2WU85_VERDV|nr:ATP dependent DNA ligase domain-containing protein [Verticillium dahliae VdLs.17]EGY17676.1 ATP dependent DNA ligase domain-containing protein [Verticillium dahliae VdLs.17]
MPFSFAHVCDLLDQLQQQQQQQQQQSGDRNVTRRIISSWFAKHRHAIKQTPATAAALFSTLLPDTRTDRVYGIQAPSLQRIVGRALCLGSSRFAHLRRYENPGSGEDLADCVAGILTETPNPVSKLDQVTVEEIDALLNGLAANCRFSSHTVRQSHRNTGCENKETLGELYRQVHAREAKWLTRIILKQIQLTALDPSIVYGSYDARLPFVARVQESFEVALTSLRELRASNPLGIGTQNLVHVIKPILGTKVGRQTWLKGRSIKHCIGLHPKRVSCEKKMDGEYCQVHVDLSKGSRSVQIFSKSGKDSTQDRAVASRRYLKGGSDTPFSQNTQICLEVRRSSGHSKRLSSLLGIRQTDRFNRLRELIMCRTGHAELVHRQVIDLSLRQGASDLRRAFAESITHREEGLVLKPDDPYFDFSKDKRSFAGCPIKLKKEYIGNFGDVGDFAVIGARYDPVKAQEYNVPGLKWTHFYYGCLTNKEDVQRHQTKPKFMVVDTVEVNTTMMKTVLIHGNTLEIPFLENACLELQIPPRIASDKLPTVIFREPLVFDIRCFSFDKPGNTGFWIPRFPQVSKVHFDRTFMDTMTFIELQAAAEEAKNMPIMEDSQELLHWISLLEGADPRGVAVDALTQSTVTSLLTPSPRRQSRTSQLSSIASPNNTPTKLCRAPSIALFTISASSEAAEPQHPNTQPCSTRESNLRQQIQEAEGLKRGSTEDCVNRADNKRPRRNTLSASAFSEHLHWSRTRPASPQCNSSTRQPLSNVCNNSSPVGITSSQSFSLDSPTKQKQSARSSYIAPSSFPVMTRREIDSSRNLVSSTSSVRAATLYNPSATDGSCQIAGHRCKMRNREILLAPCIANQLLVTESILPAHGIKSWVTDPENWRQSELSHVRDGALRGVISPPRRRRKVCFVERRRVEATRHLVKQIQALDLRLPDGERESVEMYDWRVLEDIDQYEKSSRGSSPASAKSNPWKKWWVGLV